MKQKFLSIIFAAAFIFCAHYIWAEQVTFKTQDNIQLVGEFSKPQSAKKLTIILLHGLASVKEEWTPFMKFLSSNGYGVLAYDARGHGKSNKNVSGEPVSFEYFYGRGLESDWGRMIKDLSLAVQFLKEKYKMDPKNMAVMGASLGANVALRYAAVHKEVPFAILLSPGINYQGITTNDVIVQFGNRPLAVAVSPPDKYAYESVSALQSLVNSMPSNKPALSIFVETINPGHGVQMFKRESPEKPSILEVKLLKWIQSQK